MIQLNFEYLFSRRKNLLTTTHNADEKKPAQGELSQIAALGAKEDYLGITHFKESGDVYPHDADGWPVDRGNPRGLVDQ